MKNLDKISEIIGKVTFYITFICIAIIWFALLGAIREKILNSVFEINTQYYQLVPLLGIFLWGILFVILIVGFKFLFKKLRIFLDVQEFNTKWNKSLICSSIFGILLIPLTFGISLLLMIPHYLFLNKTKHLTTKTIIDNFKHLEIAESNKYLTTKNLILLIGIVFSVLLGFF